MSQSSSELKGRLNRQTDAPDFELLYRSRILTDDLEQSCSIGLGSLPLVPSCAQSFQSRACLQTDCEENQVNSIHIHLQRKLDAPDEYGARSDQDNAVEECGVC